jgi:hypothetical protein
VKRKLTPSLLPTEQNVTAFDMLHPLVVKLADELRDLSKKKQDGLLNELKVKMVNRLLSQVKEILKSEATSQFLDLLDTETLPSNSDAVLILSQYEGAMSAFKNRYYGWDGASQRWFTQENPDVRE